MVKVNGKYKTNTTTTYQGRINCETTLWQLADGRWTFEIVANSGIALAWGDTFKTRDGAKAAMARQITNGFKKVRLAGRTLIVVA